MRYNGINAVKHHAGIALLHGFSVVGELKVKVASIKSGFGYEFTNYGRVVKAFGLFPG